jgi:hypothetical protein
MMLDRTLARFVAVFLLAAPAAQADRAVPPNVIDLPPYATPCEDVAGGTEVGAVSAITGTASHATPGCEPEPLLCDAVLRDGDRLATTDGGQLAMNVGGAWVQLGSDSAAVLRRDPDGTLVLAVERGHARVMRLGTGEVPRVETPDVVAVTAGDDVAARVAPDGSSICSWAEPLDVSIADVANCAVAVGHLDPFDVASPVPGPPPVFPPPPFPPPVCTSGTCTGPPGPQRIPVVEQPGGYEPPP